MPALTLVKLWILSVCNRVRYDWIKELVVFLCGGIFVALAFYLAHDFLNVELRGVNENTQLTLKKSASCCLYVILWIAAGKSFKDDDIAPFALRMGALRETVILYKTLRIALIVLFTAFVAQWLSAKYLYDWPLDKRLLLSLAGGVISVTTHFTSQYFRATQARRDEHQKPWSHWMTKHLVNWRLTQMIMRNRLTKGCLTLSILFVIIFCYFSATNIPSLLVAFVAFVGGCFLAMSIAFQVDEDLKQAWFERHLGISDSDYHKTLFICAISLATAQGILTFGGLALMSAYPVGEILKIILCGAVAPLMMPLLVFQIDPRRPWIQAITVALLGVIVATACYAHWLGIGAYLVFAYFAMQHTQGRYYRA